MAEKVILVDENDNAIGSEGKLKAHQKGKLHRAFSIFVFNSKGKLILQKRNKSKYHSGGMWSNTCCGHPRPGENIEKAAHRRLKEEMGFECDLKEIFSFTYNVKIGKLSENEYDHVFVGKFDGYPNPDSEEIDEWKWMSKEELKRGIKQSNAYTHWFKISIKKVWEMTDLNCQPSRSTKSL